MHWETVTPQLKEVLGICMNASVFSPFSLVGGTSLSLLYGHRKSVDIDLFTDAAYGSVDFSTIDNWLKDNFIISKSPGVEDIGFGVSYFVSINSHDYIKLDIYYTDPFIFPPTIIDGVRMADVRDVIAMKMAIIGQGGRKKDFWDLHELIGDFTIRDFINFYLNREKYGYSEKELLEGLKNFSIADEDFEPICLRGKHWEMIKYDFLKWVDDK